MSLHNAAFTQDYAPQYILPNLLLIHAWYEPLNPLSFNTPSWSISVEFYMYILLFMTLACSIAYRWLVWLCISIFSFILIATESTLLTSQVLRGLSCFFAGTICYLLYRTQYWGQLKISTITATIIEIILLLLVWYLVQSEIEYKSILASILFFIVVLFFSIEAGYLSKIFKYEVFQLFGRLSYSIYMTHGVNTYIITAIFLLLPKMFGLEYSIVWNGERYFSLGSPMFDNILIMLILSFVIGLAWLTYRYIELPGQRMGKKFI